MAAHRPAFGLRLRMVAALLAVSAVALGVAALALLPPLETRFQNEDKESLTQATTGAAEGFRVLSTSDLTPGSQDVRELARELERRTGARVIVFDQQRRRLADTDPDVSPGSPRAGPFGDVQEAFATGKRVRGTRDVSPTGQVYVDQPVEVGGKTIVIATRRSLADANAAGGVVRRAFVVAAIAALVAALLLGTGLATTLLRRLRRLQAGTSRIATEGLDAELPRDDTRDEVGELSRSFSTMQARLRQQEGVRRAFVATASHELRTPLTSLQGMLELLEGDLDGAQPDYQAARSHAEAAREQARRLTGLANDLLEMTRLDSDFALRRELVELVEICRAVNGEFVPRAGAARVRIDLADPPGPCWVLGDPDSIARVVRIMLDNALTFSPSGGRVVVQVESRDSQGIVHTQDAGPGVPPEERDFIFERFRRGSAGSEHGGFGLGLAIGRELAERMGGELRLEDSSSGARFGLILPRADFLQDDEA